MHFSLSRTATTKGEHPHTISVKLRDMNQLFNSMDPSPFIEKDLDDDAEEFIVSWAQEFSAKAPLKLRIYLEQWPSEDPKELIRTAVRNHFVHRAQITDLEFKRLMRQGRTSLFIGLLFLAACLLLSKMLLGHSGGTWAPVDRVLFRSITDLEFKRLMRQGRTSLFIGLLFLAACLLLSKMLLGHSGGTWAA